MTRDPLDWISRMIDGDFPWVTEGWIRRSFHNSYRVLGTPEKYRGGLVALLRHHRLRREILRGIEGREGAYTL